MKVLIVTKDQNSKGGVGNYFRLFYEKFFDSDVMLEHFDIGSRSMHYHRRLNRNVAYTYDLIKDLCKLILTLLQDKEIEIVHVNPSFIPVPLLRDGLVIIIAKLLRRKVLVFFHGWLDSFMVELKSSFLKKLLFVHVYKYADHILVLAGAFAEELVELGFNKTIISVTRTMFDGNLIQHKSAKTMGGLKFMFLSRISIEKGVFDIVTALSHLKKNGLEIHVDFFGHGANSTIINELKDFARDMDVIHQCHFCGYIDGADKYQSYSNHDVFLFPTFHPEGCPTVVLEALASGCFVINTNVAALKEIIVDKVHGRIVNAKDSLDLSEKIKWAVENEALVRDIGKSNKIYASENFEADVLINQMRTIYKTL